MKRLELGTKVSTSNKIQSFRTYHKKVWKTVPLRKPITGIIVGRRYVQNGEIEGGFYDEPTYFCQTSTVQCYLIAFDLHKNPIHVLPEHLEIIEDKP